MRETRCVSYCVSVPPARRAFATVNTQLVLLQNNNFFSHITYFTNRFVQYSRTVVRERPAILTALFLQYTSRNNNTCKTSCTCTDNIPTEKTVRYNYDSHYRLAQTKTLAKKSEMSVSISNQFRKIYYFIFKIISLHLKKENSIFTGDVTLCHVLTSKTSITENNTNYWCDFTNGLSNNNNVWSDKLLFLEKTSGIIAYLSRGFFIIYAPIVTSFMPTLFFN